MTYWPAAWMMYPWANKHYIRQLLGGMWVMRCPQRADLIFADSWHDVLYALNSGSPCPHTGLVHVPRDGEPRYKRS